MKKMLYLGLVAVILFATFLQFAPANAAALTAISDTMSRLKASTASNHTILFTTPTGMNSGTIVVDFNTAGFTSGSVDYTDIDLSYGANGTENEQTLAAAAGDNIWGATITTNDLTLAYPSSNGTAITAGWKVIIKIGTNATGGDQQYTNPTAGEKTITVTAGSDSGQLAVDIITNDQVTVTGTVDPSISFVISDNSVGFGHMNSSAPRYATGDLSGDPSATNAFSVNSINTNAVNGLTITVLSLNSNGTAGLYSSSVSDTITAASIATTTAPYFAFCANNTSGMTITAGFACETGGTAISTTAQTFASTTAPVSSGELAVRLKARPSGTTKASNDYATTLTVIATGNF